MENTIKYKTPEESISANPEKFRNNMAINIQILLENGNESDFENCAKNIEKGVYNYTIKEANTKKIIKKWENTKFVHLYIDRLRSVYTNIKKSEDLLIQIQNGDILPQNVAFMTHQEMNQDQWRLLIEQKIKRDASKYTTKVEASTDMYTCKKCKSKKCTYYELQTRSADESTTIFVSCLNCGKNWRG
uniref:TFIIS-type domain-containing protein n=1 Tax=viral metagenome TaxID=1070528 RepID=A0A6C0I1C0_9ZZZZ